MSNNTTTYDPCAPDDNLCIVREHEQAVIVVPTLLLLATLLTLVGMCLVRYCREQKRPRISSLQRNSRSSQRHTHGHRRHLQGVDAPPGINPLEHEELPMSVHVQQTKQNVKPTLAAAIPQASTEMQHGGFSQVMPLPMTFSIQTNDPVILYRARMDNRDVVLRVLKESANSSEKQNFLGFASFVSGLGSHRFLPALLGIDSVQSPIMMVVEELQHKDLLGFLWKCREDNPGLESPCDITEKKIFTMAGQVASALEYLHTQGCIHGNVGARSVLVGGDMTVKLWGLGSAYRRRIRVHSAGEAEDMEMKKWQAPEVLSRRAFSPSSDMWSFGILLYEMVTLGDPPFAQLLATEVLQYLQRGRHLTRPASCSTSLFSIIKSCCHWNAPQRPSMPALTRKLESGEKSANGRTVLRVPEQMDIEKYLREAGYGEAYNYAVL